MKRYHTTVFIARAQPLHLGHEHIIKTALNHSKEVIVVLGSSFSARTYRNPFTFEERKAMIKTVFPQKEVKVVPVSDYPYDDNKWVAAVQSVVRSAMSFTADPIKIALIGHNKDESSYYLNLFKSWDSIPVGNVDGINSTDIRNKMFKFPNLIGSKKTLPDVNPGIYDMLIQFALSDVFSELLNDYEKIKQYHELWETAPYPPTFVTGDAVLTQSGSVLLIKRGEFPFRNKWALPGGYLNQSETILDGVIRELREETRVKVPEKVLRGSIKESRVFDYPKRDPRGRTITHAYHIDLGFPDENLPKVKGSDDAKEAQWFTFGELQQDMLAFDHWHILNHFLKLG